ncbi:GNAT family N-acetyltransferase [Prauserella oleivorans]
MSDHRIRVLRDDEHRAAMDLFRASLHLKPAEDQEWTRAAGAFQPGRTLGAFAGDPGTLIGTARSLDSELTVPGGRTVPLAAVTGVGVRADRTRRGVLTDLMRTQFADFAERGVVAATLHASEAVIYGRFGYGVGTLARGCTIDRTRARLRPEVPAGGEVRLLDGDAAFDVLSAAYPALRTRPGMMARPAHWWTWARAVAGRGDEPTSIAVHQGPGDIDGFVVYTVTRPRTGSAVLRVDDLHAATAEAFAGLWRFLLSVDLVDEIRLGSGRWTNPSSCWSPTRACAPSRRWRTRHGCGCSTCPPRWPPASTTATRS